MGFGHLPQWQQHTILEGACTVCRWPSPYEGPVCMKPAFGAQAAMVFLGVLDHAHPCQKDGVYDDLH